MLYSSTLTFFLLSWPRILTTTTNTKTNIFVVINVVTVLDHAFVWGQVVSGRWSLYQQMSIVVSGQRSVLPWIWQWTDHAEEYTSRLYSSIVYMYSIYRYWWFSTAVDLPWRHLTYKNFNILTVWDEIIIVLALTHYWHFVPHSM